MKVLTALRNASVVTDPKNPQVVNNGGPTDIQSLVAALGAKSSSRTYTQDTLSSGVELISKPSISTFHRGNWSRPFSEAFP